MDEENGGLLLLYIVFAMHNSAIYILLLLFFNHKELCSTELILCSEDIDIDWTSASMLYPETNSSYANALVKLGYRMFNSHVYFSRSSRAPIIPLWISSWDVSYTPLFGTEEAGEDAVFQVLWLVSYILEQIVSSTCAEMLCILYNALELFSESLGMWTRPRRCR